MIYSNTLPVSDAVRDLGVTVDCNLKFDRHISAWYIKHKTGLI